MTIAQIQAVIIGYRHDQLQVIHNMAEERGLNSKSLTREQYKSLIAEEADWSDKFAQHPVCDSEEKAENAKYAKELRALVNAL